jgi:hypothetical protein
MRAQTNERMPLISAGILFQIRAAKLFAELGRTNREIDGLQDRMDQVREAFLTRRLPDGWSVQALPGAFSNGEPRFALLDGDGNDAGYPLTRWECWQRAWTSAGRATPELAEDPEYARLKATMEGARTATRRLSVQIDECERVARDDWQRREEAFSAEGLLADLL